MIDRVDRQAEFGSTEKQADTGIWDLIGNLVTLRRMLFAGSATFRVNLLYKTRGQMNAL